MRRTATRDVTVGGHQFHEGDKCILFYNSANRDDRVFPDPHRFDVRRDPNFHVGFGGPGPHFCLGAHLARREITVMFRELFQRVPNIRIRSEPDRLRSARPPCLLRSRRKLCERPRWGRSVSLREKGPSSRLSTAPICIRRAASVSGRSG
jgi:cytochrome P450